MVTKKIHVCHIVLALDMGGLEKVVVKLCETMDKRIIHSSVLCLDRIGVLGEKLVDAGFRVETMSRSGFFDIKLFKKLKNFFDENQVDIVHSHSGCMLYATLAGKLSKARGVIHTDHGRHIPERKLVVIEEFLSSLLIDKVVPVSEELKGYLAQSLYFPQRKLACIPNGIEIEEFSKRDNTDKVRKIKGELGIQSDRMLIGTIGRLTYVKNHALLLKSFASILKMFPKSILLIIGNGPELPFLKDLAKKLHILEKTFFLGERDDIPLLLSMLDLFILPSLSEGTSVTLLEALSAGIPVIASNVGGNSHIILNEETGLLFENNDKDELIEKIGDLFSDSEKAVRLAENGKEHVKKLYGIEEMNNRYLTLYNQCLENGV